MKNPIKTMKTKSFALIIIVLMMASVLPMAMFTQPVKAQTTLPAGVTPTHVQSSGSIPLPAGVTPDVTLDTLAALSFTPNPIGVGQPLLVNVWLHPPTHGSRYLSDYTVTFTKPDGTTDTKVVNSYEADTTAWFNYYPDEVGTWQIKFDFLGGYFPAGNYTGDPFSLIGAGPFSFTQSLYYKPSHDGPYNFTVQEQPVMSWPPSPLPTDYWTRPISPENREWWPIIGSYPGTGIVGGGTGWPADTNTYMSNYRYTPYVLGPTTAHVVWRRQGAEGGLIGGTSGIRAISGNSGTPTLVYDGRCYQTLNKAINGVPQSVWECYNLRTGQVYWDQTGNTQIPTIVSYSQQAFGEVPGAAPNIGGTPVLVYVGSGRYIVYDPYTGNMKTDPVTGANINISIAPLTTGTCYMDPYFLTVQNIGTSANPDYRLINWTVTGVRPGSIVGLTNYTFTVMNNITWPFSSLPASTDYESGISVTTYSITPPSASGVAQDIGLEAASLTTGRLLWNFTAGVGFPLFSGSTAVADHGKFAVRFDDGYWRCWDLSSGTFLWKSPLTTWPWGTFGCYGVQSYGGNIIANQYDGIAAYNWSTGKVSWLFQAKAPYSFETPYQDNYPWFTGTSTIGDGMLYAYNTEHSPSQPITRGWKIYCINITTGQDMWNITGSMAPGAIADGYLTAASSYDGYMYVFGKGKSATTVSVPQTQITSGNSVIISGTVMDMSPGDQGSFNNPTAPLDSSSKQGTVPCVSDDSMETQMEFLYMQHPIDGLDHNVTMTGVPVTLTALDPNGNSIDIGTVSSDAYYGTFSKTWTPSTVGDYKIVASFAGDNSYGSSSAATAVSVGAGTSASPSPSTAALQTDNMPVISAVAISAIAIIIAIAIVGFLVLRKRA